MPINRSFYFIRDGETDWNKEGLLQGVTDMPLNTRGRTQAFEASKLINQLPIDIIITSNLARAEETAEIVNKKLQLPIIVEPEIAEVNFGDLEGITYQESNKHTEDIAKKQPDLIEKTGYALGKNGEPYAELNKRVISAVNKQLKKYPDKTILFSSHAAVFRALALSVTKKYVESNNAYIYFFEKINNVWKIKKV